MPARPNLKRAAVLAASGVLALSGCAAILGIEEPSDRALDGGADHAADSALGQDAAGDSAVEHDAGDGRDGASSDGGTEGGKDGGPDVGTGFVSISVGDHACGVTGDGRVACWGSNELAQVAPGSDAGVLYAPEFVKGVTDAKQVSVAQRTSCALLGNGKVKCWGVLGNAPIPVQTIQAAGGGDLIGVEAVDLGFGPGGYSGAGALVVLKMASGGAQCLGSDDMGGCSTGAPLVSATPTPMLSAPATPFAGVVDVAAGESGFSCTVVAGGVVRCSGNVPRADGVSGGVFLASTAKVTGGATNFTGAANVAAGYQHACAVQAADRGVVNCWGANNFGQLGIATPGVDYPEYVQGPVGGLTGKVMNLSAGYQHSCVSLDNGTAQCWGYGGNGQLGQGQKISSTTAVTVQGLPGGKVVRSVSAGFQVSCATMTDGTGYCWGKGDKGQLGDGMGQQSDIPVQVSAPK